MKIFSKLFFAAILCLSLGACNGQKQDKRLVFVYGNSVHMWGDHENRLMAEILADIVSKNTPIRATAISAYDKNLEKALKDSDAAIIISEGREEHPFKGENFAKLDAVKNLGVYHYALDFDESENTQKLAAKIGGAFEPHWSVNPAFDANFKNFAHHEISNGVKPFGFYDEWYFNMRFDENACTITHIAQTVPPDHARKRSFGSHSGNKFVRENLGRAETILWICEKPDGSRGLGFTGGHTIFSLYNPELRKLLVNSAAWLAGEKIPESGFDSQMPPFNEVCARITKEKRRDYDSFVARWRKLADEWESAKLSR